MTLEIEISIPKMTIRLSEPKPSSEPFRYQVLGFDSDGPIAAGAVGTVPSTPQWCFRTEEVGITESVAKDFDVLDVKVGHRSQFLNGNVAPASAFCPKGAVKFDTAQVGQVITMVVRNKSGAPARFQAAMFGTTVNDPPFAPDYRYSLLKAP